MIRLGTNLQLVYKKGVLIPASRKLVPLHARMGNKKEAGVSRSPLIRRRCTEYPPGMRVLRRKPT
jgi:hypothetical protein